MTGRFIVIEGIDGAGTTTQARLLAEWMGSRGWPTLATREPSDGPVGRLLREILAGAHAPVGGTTMALLFAADRMDHLSREIEPALAAGRNVVSDRYYHSSLAYQAEETERGFVESLNLRARRPDVTFLLDLPAEVAAERRARAGRDVERYDDLALQRRIAQSYRRLATEWADRESILLIDGGRPVDEVQARLRKEVEHRCS